MNSPLLSVVIPCFNVAPFIEECVKHLLSHPVDAEILLVDNASEDDTWLTLEIIKQTYPQVSLFQQPEKGACAARNLGLKKARGRFIKFLDADDLVDGHQLDHQLKELESTSADILFSPFVKRNVRGEEHTVLPLKDVWKGLFTTQLGLTSALLFRTDAVKNVQGWNPALSSSQEYDLLFRLLQQGATYSFSAEVAAQVRERETGQISTSNPVPRWSNYLELRVSILEHLTQTKTEYFAKESGFFYQAFFDVLHICFPYLPERTLELHNRYIVKRFTPQTSAACSSKFLLLYRIFGFSGAERIKKIAGI
jgi:glycosyltransferase involved in cell wall biosynthesis